MAKDIYHNAVCHGLEREGWTITHDPLEIDFGEVLLKIDLGAEQLIAAQKQGEKIAVEIKSFLGVSTIYQFHTALGQYYNYRFALKAVEPERLLYLAVPSSTYKDFFSRRFTQMIVEEVEIKLIVFNPLEEEIVQWKS
ncbi:MAG: XisH family protein [Hormoscilla sp. SP5CHS1]|nr:XisH family protein [Hormoscilla sp. SP12CHS1]MBC6452779.1 XisH family protein [Hormoscilla sp. SP5CHS1]